MSRIEDIKEREWQRSANCTLYEPLGGAGGTFLALFGAGLDLMGSAGIMVSAGFTVSSGGETGEFSSGAVIFIPGGGGVFAFFTFFGARIGSGSGESIFSGAFSTGLAAKIQIYTWFK